ncbi:MAG: anhydro-N-acetylmuramic acid kinase [Burkholderiales bacterium]|nr:anhydro-N-acetylmuramic acid kinase [Burkholderiales bacterium]
MREFYIGLMSGTSLDGVDGVLAQWPAQSPAQSPAQRPAPGSAFAVHAFTHRPFAPPLRDELLALNWSGADEIHRAALAANALAREYATVVAALLEQARVGAADVAAIGAHGQTVRHRPGEFDGTGYTVQLLDGALLAERTHIDVVCDLRSRDVAAGGQGAPLVPAFHAACLADRAADVAVLNVGGIANLTLLPAAGGVRGFDCGPGNLLMDLWCRRQRGQPYDADGAWAAGGQIDQTLLRHWLREPFFDRAPPKSTGRDLFDAAWLDAGLAAAGAATPAQDVMATLAELTARSAIDALRRHAPSTTRLWVCGGGAFNAHLMRRLAALTALAGDRVSVATTAAAGLPPDQVEALAFAWLARCFVARRPGNLPAVTGAVGPRVLGALYPA